MLLPVPPPAWLQWVQALSVPTLATVGAVIALQQVLIARTKLQHDLFDRRVEVYRAIREALAYIADHGDITLERLSSLHAATSVAPFLFPRFFATRIRDIERRVTDLFDVCRSLEKLDDQPAYAERQEKLSGEAQSHKHWLRVRLATLTRVFEPYVRIGPT